ncbi:hypothetical protein STAQ_16370 [Allostella sp. ATCC 35155]|nr:hypothetical protein STAQ_16370 [Stella sp. ATCC 35155]
MPALSILHATDLHLRQALPGSAGHAVRRSREIPTLLERLGEVVARQRPDLVVLTGDLVDVPHPLLHGDPADHATAMAEAEADYRLLRGWLDRLPCPWRAIPGNHDRLDAFEAAFGTGRETESHHGGFRVVGFEDWEVAGNQAQRVGAQRALFERVLADPDPAPQIHLQHYLIRPDVDYGYPLMYREAADLAAAIERSGRVRAVLSGHWHQGEPPLTVGDTTYSVCPTFCEWPHRYRLVTCTEAGVRIETRAIEAPEARRWRPAVFVVLDRQTPDIDHPTIDEAGARLLLRTVARGWSPVLVAPWEPHRFGWRAAQELADGVARHARALGHELGAAYFVVDRDLDPALRARLPAEGTPTASDLFPRAERELGLDLAGSILVGGGDALAAAARDHGLALHPAP